MLAKASNYYLFHKRKKASLTAELIAAVSFAFILAPVKPQITDRL
jgi:hypothetical protein